MAHVPRGPAIDWIRLIGAIAAVIATCLSCDAGASGGTSPSLTPLPPAAVATVTQTAASTTAPTVAATVGQVAAADASAVMLQMDAAVKAQTSNKSHTVWAGTMNTTTIDNIIDDRHQAPDRSATIQTRARDAASRSASIIIGRTIYLMATASAPWTVSQSTTPVPIALAGISDRAVLATAAVTRSQCGTGTCVVLSVDTPLAAGKHSVNLAIDEQTKLPMRFVITNTFDDGTFYTVGTSWFDWGIPNVIEAPRNP